MNVLRFSSVSIVWRTRSIFVGLILLCLLCGLALFLLTVGTMSMTYQDVIEVLTGSNPDIMLERVLWYIRLPRVLTAIMAGAALGMSGALFQSISRNPLGSPDLIGFTTGAATGAIVQIVLFRSQSMVSMGAAFLGGILTAAAVFVLARKDDTTGGQRLILIGIGVGAILSGVNTTLLVMGDLDQALAAQLWLSGSLNARSWVNVLTATLGFGVAAPVAIWFATRLSLMEMGDGIAISLGVSTGRTRFLLVMAAVVLTAAATAAVGPVAFIALSAPHIARYLTASPNVPIVSGALMGAILLMMADMFSQMFASNIALPIGMVTGLLGGFYFLLMIAFSRAQ